MLSVHRKNGPAVAFHTGGGYIPTPRFVNDPESRTITMVRHDRSEPAMADDEVKERVPTDADVESINLAALSVLCTDRGAADAGAVPILEQEHKLTEIKLVLGRRAIRRASIFSVRMNVGYTPTSPKVEVETHTTFKDTNDDNSSDDESAELEDDTSSVHHVTLLKLFGLFMSKCAEASLNELQVCASYILPGCALFLQPPKPNVSPKPHMPLASPPPPSLPHTSLLQLSAAITEAITEPRALNPADFIAQLLVESKGEHMDEHMEEDAETCPLDHEVIDYLIEHKVAEQLESALGCIFWSCAFHVDEQGYEWFEQFDAAALLQAVAGHLQQPFDWWLDGDLIALWERVGAQSLDLGPVASISALGLET